MQSAMESAARGTAIGHMIRVYEKGGDLIASHEYRGYFKDR
jgi:hypothetical protein